MLPIVFDLDGTLIDSLPNITDAVNLLLGEMSRDPLPATQVAGFVGLGEQVLLDRLIAATGLEREDRAQLMTRFLHHYEITSKDTRLIDGVEPVLEALKGAGAALGLCTNKPRVALEPVLEHSPLGALLDAVVAGDDVPRRKPDPAPLLLVLEKLGATRCLYVGDTIHDAQTAQNAGMPFALYTEGIRDDAPIPADVEFSDFAELPEIWRRF